MAFPGVGVQAACISGETSFDKVSEVIAAASEFPDDLKLFVIGNAMGIRALDKVALRAVENHADFIPFGLVEESVDFFVGGIGDVQAAGFKDKTLVPIVV